MMDIVGSKGAVRMLAVVVVSREMLLLAVQERVYYGWHADRVTAQKESWTKCANHNLAWCYI